MSSDFTVEISQNEYLAEGASDVNAIVTVTAPDTGLVQSGPQAGDYPTGAWGAGESRDYHLCVRVTPAGFGQEMLAARVSLVAATPSGPDVLGQGLVRAIWTDDEALSTRINGSVAHYTGQAELAPVIDERLEASKRGGEELGHRAARPGGRAGRAVRQRGHRQAPRQGGRRGRCRVGHRSS